MSTSSVSPRRRRLMLGALGTTSALAGLAWNWFSLNAEAAGAKASSGAPALAPVADTAAWWTQRFDRPEGGELALASLKGKPLLVNFWATWCPPCVKEMPQLDLFARENSRGVRVVGLAVDSPTPVREFLKKTPVGFPIGLAGFGGTELARALGNATGALPFSVLFDARGAVVQRKLGETSNAELQQWAAALRA